MLSWSAQETNRHVDLVGIVDAEVDPGLPGGKQLATLGRAVITRGRQREAFDATAAELGAAVALDAAAVAANFEIMNRVVDAVGLPIGARRREDARPTIELLGLDSLPHARH